MTTTDYCQSLDKKMKLLTYFKRYMTEHLVKAGANNVNFESDQISRMPHLHSWFRTTCAVVMHLTNGSLQVCKISNFIKAFTFSCQPYIFQLNFSDHMKIILCPRMSAITYMDHEKNFRTYRFSTIKQHGCSKDLYQKMRYAHEKLSKMLEKMLF